MGCFQESCSKNVHKGDLESHNTSIKIMFFSSVYRYILFYTFYIFYQGHAHYILGWPSRRRAENRSDKKKNWQMSFYFIFSSDMPLSCPQIVHFSGKKLAKTPKNQWNSWNFPFVFFFPPTWTGMQILFFIFFSPTSLNNPCRDPSTVEYSERATMDFLIDAWLVTSSRWV